MYRLDPQSRRAVTRVLLLVIVISAWCLVIHMLIGRPVRPERMLLAAAGAALGFAVAGRERPMAESLNRWDEATAFLGLACLASLVGSSVTTTP